MSNKCTAANNDLLAIMSTHTLHAYTSSLSCLAQAQLSSSLVLRATPRSYLTAVEIPRSHGEIYLHGYEMKSGSGLGTRLSLFTLAPLYRSIASNLETVWARYLPPPAILPLPQGAAVV